MRRFSCWLRLADKPTGFGFESQINALISLKMQSRLVSLNKIGMELQEETVEKM